jgi:hypothetical protein
MVYNTRHYWVFGLCPSSGVLIKKQRNVSETGSVSVHRWGETPALLDLLEVANLNNWT